ncbi:MAG: 2-amino-4-hydroxy-6-hydroxymethyldihydropteridine diphosphokinase [Bacteroidetes bacterium]|nr:2-amino-4-hydroxy-6-hydroxymethyldihydropteridine diphosphokinase [Bacteroidota bacterium]
MTNQAFLCTGSNMENPQHQMEIAETQIALELGKIIGKSKIYSSEPWGNPDQETFLNQVIQIETKLSPQMLLKKILDIEIKMGRSRIQKWGPRIIDIDILFYGDHIIHMEGLQIPHPQMQNRRFVLMPLCEIAPDFIHPELLVSVKQLLEKCEDSLSVSVF